MTICEFCICYTKRRYQIYCARRVFGITFIGYAQYQKNWKPNNLIIAICYIDRCELWGFIREINSCIFTCENISFFPPELLLHSYKCSGYVPCCVTVNTHTIVNWTKSWNAIDDFGTQPTWRHWRHMKTSSLKRKVYTLFGFVYASILI
jgi:hypothetical protein